MSLLETFLTASPASQGATILFHFENSQHNDLLAKAINPSGLAFGQLRCIRGKMRHIQTFH